MPTIRPQRTTELRPKERALVHRVQQTLAPDMEASTVVFFDEREREFLGAGVLVNYRNKTWIATAAHVVTKILGRLRAPRVAWAAPGSHQDFHDIAFSDVAEAWSPSDEGDIAAVLLKDDSARRLHNAIVITDERLDRDRQPRTTIGDDLVWLVGSPLALRDALRERHRLPQAQMIAILGTHMKECDPDHHASDNPNRGERLPSLDYHIDYSVASHEGGGYTDLFAANGFSGGPLWSARIDAAGIWSGSSSRVAGIAWYQNTTTRCIRAVPMGEWFSAADAVLAEHENGR